MIETLSLRRRPSRSSPNPSISEEPGEEAREAVDPRLFEASESSVVDVIGEDMAPVAQRPYLVMPATKTVQQSDWDAMLAGSVQEFEQTMNHWVEATVAQAHIFNQRLLFLTQIAMHPSSTLSNSG